MVVSQPPASAPGSWRVHPFMQGDISNCSGYNGKLDHICHPHKILPFTRGEGLTVPLTSIHDVQPTFFHQTSVIYRHMAG